MAEPLAVEGTGYEVVESEPPEVLGRNLVSAGYLLAGATAFFFVSFLFAYFYLRSLNNGGMWRPKRRRRLVGWGTAVVACYVVSALLVRLGLADHRALRRGQWRLKGALALLVGVVGLVLQVVAWTQQSFGPADGGYASVYFGWTAFIFLFVLGTLLWLEMTLATSFRYRKIETGAPGAGRGVRRSAPRRRTTSATRSRSSAPSSSALSFYWTFLAGIAVVTWIVLYLI